MDTRNTRIGATTLGAATVEFERAQDAYIDTCGDLQEGGRPDFTRVNARLSAAVAALKAEGVDPYEPSYDPFGD
jgi:hypothetical protein